MAYKVYGNMRFLPRSDTSANWEAANPVLERGEWGAVIGVNETGDLLDTVERMKVGDGITPWNDLPWWNGPQGPQGEKGEKGDGVGQITEKGGEIFNSYEGEDLNQALDIGAHAEGRQTIANKNAHAEGRSTQALGNASHAEGNHSVATGNMGAHAEGRETRAIADSSHAQGIGSIAGTKAFKVTAIDFTTTEEQPGEEMIGAVATYYVSTQGHNDNDGLSIQTSVTSIARAIELANAVGYIAGDVVFVRLDKGENHMGALPKYVFDLVVSPIQEDVRTTVALGDDRLIANNEGHNTYYKNIEISLSAQFSNMQMCSSNVVFDENCVLKGYYATLVLGTSSDDGASKQVAGQKVVINSNTLPNISLSNLDYAAKTYMGDVELELNNPNIYTKILFNASYFDKINGQTTYNQNVNINIKDVQNLSFDNLTGVTFNSAVQIINSSPRVSINRWMYGLSQINAPMWILTNRTGYKDLLSFTDLAGIFKVKEGYVVKAIDGFGDEVLSDETTHMLDLSAKADMYTFEIAKEEVHEGRITLTTSEGLETNMLVSIKSKSNQDFILNAGVIKAINNQILSIEGYPSQINRFLSADDVYLFVLSDATLGDEELGDGSAANGYQTKAIGNYSCTNGIGTIAVGDSQYICGTFNLNKPNTVFELGCGTSDVNRTNAFEVYKDGTVSVYGLKLNRSNLRKLLETIL